MGRSGWTRITSARRVYLLKTCRRCLRESPINGARVHAGVLVGHGADETPSADLREADLRDVDNVRAAGLRSARQGIVRGVAEEGGGGGQRIVIADKRILARRSDFFQSYYGAYKVSPSM
jgi:hypothetical protein